MESLFDSLDLDSILFKTRKAIVNNFDASKKIESLEYVKISASVYICAFDKIEGKDNKNTIEKIQTLKDLDVSLIVCCDKKKLHAKTIEMCGKKNIKVIEMFPTMDKINSHTHEFINSTITTLNNNKRVVFACETGARYAPYLCALFYLTAYYRDTDINPAELLDFHAMIILSIFKFINESKSNIENNEAFLKHIINTEFNFKLTKMKEVLKTIEVDFDEISSYEDLCVLVKNKLEPSQSSKVEEKEIADTPLEVIDNIDQLGEF